MLYFAKSSQSKNVLQNQQGHMTVFSSSLWKYCIKHIDWKFQKYLSYVIDF